MRRLALVVGIAAASLGAKARLGTAPDQLRWSGDSQYVLAGIDGGGSVRFDRRGRPTAVPEGGLERVRLSPEGRLVLGARGAAFVSVDLETLGVEELPMSEAQGKPVSWLRGPFGDVIVTKTLAHYSIRRTGGRSSDADAAPTQNFRDLSLDPTDPLAYVDTGYGLEVRHLLTGLTLRVFDSGRKDQRYVGAARDPEGRIVLAVQDADGFRIWTPPDPSGPSWEVDDDAPKSMSGDGTRIAVGTAEGVAIHSTATRDPVALLKTRAPVAKVAFSPDGTALAAALTDGRVKVWQLGESDLLLPIQRALTEIDVGRIRTEALGRGGLAVRRAGSQHSLAGATVHLEWTPLGKLSGWVGGKLVEIESLTGTERELKVRDVLPGRPYAWSADGSQLAVVTAAGVGLYETRRWRLLREIPTGGGHVQLDWHGRTLTVDAGAGRARSWDAETGEPLGDAFTMSTEATARFVASPDGELLAVTGRMPRVVRASDGEVVARLDAQWAGAVAAAWSDDGRRLATAGGDSTVIVWDTAGWRPAALLEGAHGRELAFSPDGRKLLAVSWEGAVVANIDSGNIEEALAFEGLLSSIDWSEQGIVMVDNAGSLYVWPELRLE